MTTYAAQVVLEAGSVQVFSDHTDDPCGMAHGPAGFFIEEVEKALNIGSQKTRPARLVHSLVHFHTLLSNET